MGGAVIVDIVGCCIIAIYLIVGIFKGFINQAFKVFSVIIAMLLAYFLCSELLEFCDDKFNILSGLTNKIEPLFAKNDALNTVYNEATFSETMNSLHLPKFIIDNVQNLLSRFDGITIAYGISSVLARYIGLLICFIVIFIVAKLLLRLLKLVLNGIFKLPVLNSINKLFGGIFGAVLGAVTVSFILYIIALLPTNIGNIQTYIADSTIMNYLSNHNILSVIFEAVFKNLDLSKL